MAAAASRRRHKHGAEHESDERWLLTYADMITLLMALFMVLFSISSVNISKYVTLQQSLHQAFSGSILTGGRAINQAGSTSSASQSPSEADIQSIVPPTPNLGNPSGTTQQTDTVAQQTAAAQAAAAQREQQDFVHLKAQLDAYARVHHFGDEVKTVIQRDGLDVEVLTSGLFFASGQATLQPQGIPLLSEIANLLNVDRTHPINVSGDTDNVPIHSAQFPSNWELSTARADTVVRFLIGRGVNAGRLTATGYADLRPIASNATAQGRAQNRRVEILLQRKYNEPASTPG